MHFLTASSTVERILKWYYHRVSLQTRQSPYDEIWIRYYLKYIETYIYIM